LCAQRAIRRAETWEKPLRVVGLQRRHLDCDDCGIDQALSMMICDAVVSLACGWRHEQVDRISSHLVARSRLAVTRRASSVVGNAWRSFRDMRCGVAQYTFAAVDDALKMCLAVVPNIAIARLPNNRSFSIFNLYGDSRSR
jgi:hypothetical protein